MPGKYAKIDPTIYGCKFDRVCPGFNSEKYRCTHGGGLSCRLWCKFLNYEMFATNERPRYKQERSDHQIKKFKVLGP